MGYSANDQSKPILSDRFDYVIFAGDLNYRVNQPREFVDRQLQLGNLEVNFFNVGFTMQR
jgi:hypothetical protein